MKTRWLLLAACCGFLGVVSSGCDVDLDAGNDVRGDFDRTLAVSGPVDLDLLSGSGGVQIGSGPVDSIHIVGHIRAGMWPFGGDPEDRVKQIVATPPIQQTGNRIRIGDTGNDERYRNVSISYEVTVPEATSVHSRVGSGGQRISHIHGPVDAISGSGGVHLEEITGKVDAVAGSGGIEISGVRAEVHARTGSGGIRIEGQPLQAWDLKTGSGGIRMHVTGDVPFSLDARAGSGGIESRQPVQSIGEVSKHELHGTVRGGGPQVQLATGSGGIRVE